MNRIDKIITVAKNKNWKAKVRQQLQIHCMSVERGVWAMPS